MLSTDHLGLECEDSGVGVGGQVEDRRRVEASYWMIGTVELGGGSRRG